MSVSQNPCTARFSTADGIGIVKRHGRHTRRCQLQRDLPPHRADPNDNRMTLAQTSRRQQLPLANVAVARFTSFDFMRFSLGNWINARLKQRRIFAYRGRRKTMASNDMSGATSIRVSYSRCHSSSWVAKCSASSGQRCQSTTTAERHRPPGPAEKRSRDDVRPVRPRIAMIAQSQWPKTLRKVVSSVWLGSTEAPGWVCSQMRANCSGWHSRIDHRVEEVGHGIIIEGHGHRCRPLTNDQHILDEKQVVLRRETEASDLGRASVTEKLPLQPCQWREPKRRFSVAVS